MKKLKSMKLMSSVLCIMLMFGVVVNPTQLNAEGKAIGVVDVLNPIAGTSSENAVDITANINELTSGQTLTLAEGYYKVNAQTKVTKKNTKIIGAGKDKTIIKIENALTANSIGLNIQSQGINEGANIPNIEFSDFTISHTSRSDTGSVFLVSGVNNVLFKNIKTIGGSYGFNLNPSNGGIIDGCEINNASKTAIGVGAYNESPSNVTIKNTITNLAGWGSDIAIFKYGLNTPYGNSTVKIENGNTFKNGKLYTEDLESCKFEFNGTDLPKYKALNDLDPAKSTYKIYSETPTISLDKSEVVLEVGQSIKVNATINSIANISKVYGFTTSDPKIATTDREGNITAIASGSTTFTVTAANDAIISGKIIVNEPKVEVEVEVPNLDTTRPTDKVAVGISDEKSKVILSEVASNLAKLVKDGKDVSKDIISVETKANLKKAIDDGKVISTKVSAKNITIDEIDIKEVKKINEELKNITGKNEVIKVAQFIDLSVMLQGTLDNETDDLGNIYELAEPIKFQILIPEEFKKEGRTYEIARIHNGEVTILPLTINEDGTYTGETDKFSTYALIYTEKAVAGGNGTIVNPPSTGDTTSTTTWMLLVSLSALAIFVNRARKNICE